MHRAAGIVGSAIFDDYAVRIDYVGKSVSICPAGCAAELTGGAGNVIDIKDGCLPFVNGYITGEREAVHIEFLVDTGNPHTALLSLDLIDQTAVAVFDRSTGINVDRAWRHVTPPYYTAAVIECGNVDFRNVACARLPKMFDMMECRAVIGNALMARMCVIIDKTAKRMAMEAVR